MLRRPGDSAAERSRLEAARQNATRPDQRAPDSEREALRERLLEIFQLPVGLPLADELFNELALAVFAWQYERNRPFAAFCRNRDRTPATVTHWTEVPAVPTVAFKHVELVAGDRKHAQAVFRTSGTTLGGQRRGAHYVLDLALYHGALLPCFQAYLLPDHSRPLMLSLVPHSSELPDSSLAHMIAVVIQQLGPHGSGWYATVERGIDTDSLERVLRDCSARHAPVCLLGTSIAFRHWLDGLEQRGDRLELPPGSRLMDTGGYKARDRTIPPGEALARYADLLGIGADWCVNEYGMTELCSQHYDAQLRDRTLGREPRARRKVPAPWLRTRVVDPQTLAPVPTGQEGLLQHFDLANLGSVLAVQTEDTGMAVEDGIQITGRVLGAPPRGCSIAMDELLRIAGRSGHTI